MIYIDIHCFILRLFVILSLIVSHKPSRGPLRLFHDFNKWFFFVKTYTQHVKTKQGITIEHKLFSNWPWYGSKAFHWDYDHY